MAHYDFMEEERFILPVGTYPAVASGSKTLTYFLSSPVLLRSSLGNAVKGINVSDSITVSENGVAISKCLGAVIHDKFVNAHEYAKSHNKMTYDDALEEAKSYPSGSETWIFEDHDQGFHVVPKDKFDLYAFEKKYVPRAKVNVNATVQEMFTGVIK